MQWINLLVRNTKIHLSLSHYTCAGEKQFLFPTTVSKVWLVRSLSSDPTLLLTTQHGFSAPYHVLEYGPHVLSLSLQFYLTQQAALPHAYSFPEDELKSHPTLPRSFP